MAIWHKRMPCGSCRGLNPQSSDPQPSAMTIRTQRSPAFRLLSMVQGSVIPSLYTYMVPIFKPKYSEKILLFTSIAAPYTIFTLLFSLKVRDHFHLVDKRF